MMRRVFFLMVLGMILLPLLVSAKIVVLTETPVAEFSLPDGSVLKNAFVWKRSSEGLMIIHDDGQYYLNFRTLPDDWRAAYAVMDEIGQVASAATERFDQYLIFEIIPAISGLKHTAVTFYKSERYHNEVDDALLTACALQSFLEGNTLKAKNICGMIKQVYPDYHQIDVDALYELCSACEAAGSTTYDCPSCKGSGKCQACGGDGELDSEFENSENIHCIKCRGTGACPRCRGKKKVSVMCAKCKGSGKLMLYDKVRALQAKEVERLNKFFEQTGR